MRSRLDSDLVYDPRLNRAPSPYMERIVLINGDDDERSVSPVHHDEVYLIQRRCDPAADRDQVSDSFIRVTVTPSQSPPSPSSSFLSFDSSQSSYTGRTSASSERGYASSYHHPSASQTSISSISSARSMPPMQSSTRTAVGLYVYHNIKPKKLLSSSKKQKHLQSNNLFLHDSRPSLDSLSKENVCNEPMGTSTHDQSPNRSRSKSISSSLRGLTGSIRRKSSMFFNATTPPPNTLTTPPPMLTIPPPELMITPSTPTVMSPLSPIELPAPESVRRMRQFHKVTRTLGENIPPELIFGTGTAGSSVMADKQHAPADRQRVMRMHNGNFSISSITPIMTPLPVSSSDESDYDEDNDDDSSLPDRPASMVFEVAFEDNQRPESTATIVSPIAFAAPVPPTPPRSIRTLPDCPEDVSSNQSPHSPISRPTSPECNPFMLSRPDTPFLDTAVPAEPNHEMFKPELNAAVRKERRQGWSGEWNRGDMQDVISKLRMLK